MAYVKIHSGTEAVSMSATEGLSVDATVGCVYRGGSLLPLEYRVGLVVGAALTVELRAVAVRRCGIVGPVRVLFLLSFCVCTNHSVSGSGSGRPLTRGCFLRIIHRGEPLVQRYLS